MTEEGVEVGMKLSEYDKNYHGNEDHDGDNNDDEEEEEDRDNENASLTKNQCTLVWQGVVPKRIFTGFKFQVFIRH